MIDMFRRHLAGRPRHRGRPARVGRRPQRFLAPVALLVGATLGQALPPGDDAAPYGVVAAWTASTGISASVTQAKVTNAFTVVAGGGTVTNGISYSVSSTLVTSATRYVDLVNTSAVPATLSLTVATGSLVGSTTVGVCPVAWNTTNGTCAGGATPLDFSLLLGVNQAAYTTPTAVAVGGRVRLRIAVSGNATATATALVPTTRAGMDRTSA